MLPWAISLGFLVVLWLVIARFRNPQLATGITAAVSLLFPTWSVVEIAGLPVNIREAAVIISLLMYCIHPRSTYPVRLLWMDYAAILIIISQGISDTLADGFTMVGIIRAYGEWGVPYIAGRLAFENFDDVKELAFIATICVCLLGVGSIFEAFSKSLFGLDEGVRLWEIPFGMKPEENFPRNAGRWTLLRAWGTCLHPIYFANTMLIFWAFSAFMLCRVARGKSDGYWAIAFPITLVGIFCSLSRGAIIGSAIAVCCLIAIVFPRIRWLLMAVLLAGVVTAMLFTDATSEILTDIGEKTAETKRETTISVEGEDLKFSGTQSRVLIFKIYKRALREAGLFGYGTQRVEQFPPDVPVNVENLAAQRRVEFVDNSYVYLTMRIGYLGASGFIAVLGLAIFRILNTGFKFNTSTGAMAGCIAASLIAMAFVLLTVWQARDYTYWLFWLLGAVSGRVWESAREYSVSSHVNPTNEHSIVTTHTH